MEWQAAFDGTLIRETTQVQLRPILPHVKYSQHFIFLLINNCIIFNFWSYFAEKWPGKLDLFFRISYLLDLHVGGRLLFIIHY